VSVRRSRLVALLAVLACITLAAAGVKASTDFGEYQVLHARLGEPSVVEDGEITVQGVQVGTSLAKEGTVTATSPGMFVAVTVEGAATGSESLLRSEARLLARGDRVYDRYGSFNSFNAKPGFAERVDFVFEVDPAEIDDLTLEIWRVEIVHGYQARLQVHLGITPGNADAWRAAGAGRVIEPVTIPVSRVLS
jgi:hypothetical protein